MNPNNRRDRSNNSNRVAEAISAIPVAGAVVAVSLLLSGLTTIGSYHSVLAQENMNQAGGGNATTTSAAAAVGGNQSEIRMHVEEARAALQNNNIQGALMHLDIAMNLIGVSTGDNATGASTVGATNMTSGGGTSGSGGSANSSPSASSLTGGTSTGGGGATAGSGVGTFGGGGGTNPSPEVSTIYGGTPSSGGGGTEANMTTSTTGSANSTG